MRRISSFPCLAMRSKQRAVVAPTAPTLSDYSNLARTLAAQKESASASGSDGSTTATTRSDGEEGKAVKRRYTGKCSDVGKGSTSKEDMPPPPVPPKRKQSKAEVAEPPQKKVAKVSPNVVTDADMEKAERFNPSSLPFSLGWHNFNKLKQFYDLDNHETTSILLAMVGPTPEGQAIWSKYKAPRHYTPIHPQPEKLLGRWGGSWLVKKWTMKISKKVKKVKKRKLIKQRPLIRTLKSHSLVKKFWRLGIVRMRAFPPKPRRNLAKQIIN